MNATIREWIDKADADFATAERELAVTESPNYDAVCFHAQQSVEKLMKAAIILNGSTPSKTHRLIRLDEELSAVCPHWSTNRDELRLLTRAAVDFRYPGETAVFEEADEAVNVARNIRSDLMALLRS